MESNNDYVATSQASKNTLIKKVNSLTSQEITGENSDSNSIHKQLQWKERITRMYKTMRPITSSIDPSIIITKEYFDKHGFQMPLRVDSPQQIGLQVPQVSTFSNHDLEKAIGSEHAVKIIDVATQLELADNWKLRDWMEYFSTSKRKRDRVFNLISLECSSTKLAKIVKAPKFVSQMGLVETLWPKTSKLDRARQPHVSLYCLMSASGSFTEFHIDFGGSSVWYHVFRGRKTFFCLPPTSKNLGIFKEWQSAYKFGDSDLLEQLLCQEDAFLVEVDAGQSLLIPSGFIHCVSTPEDSIAFGGNFLTGQHLAMQLKCHNIERSLKIDEKFYFPQFDTIMWYTVSNYAKLFNKSNGVSANITPWELDGLVELVLYLENWLDDQELPTGGQNTNDHIAAIMVIVNRLTKVNGCKSPRDFLSSLRNRLKEKRFIDQPSDTDQKISVSKSRADMAGEELNNIEVRDGNQSGKKRKLDFETFQESNQRGDSFCASYEDKYSKSLKVIGALIEAKDQNTQFERDDVKSTTSDEVLDDANQYENSEMLTKSNLSISHPISVPTSTSTSSTSSSSTNSTAESDSSSDFEDFSSDDKLGNDDHSRDGNGGKVVDSKSSNKYKEVTKEKRSDDITTLLKETGSSENIVKESDKVEDENPGSSDDESEETWDLDNDFPKLPEAPIDAVLNRRKYQRGLELQLLPHSSLKKLIDQARIHQNFHMQSTSSRPSLKKRGTSFKVKSTDMNILVDIADDNWMVDCSCGIHAHNYDDGTEMVQCDKCNSWLHLWCESKRLGYSIQREAPFLCFKCDQVVSNGGSMKETNHVPADDKVAKEWMFDCKCGVKEKNFYDGTSMVECEICRTWQHSICMGIIPNTEVVGYNCIHCQKKKKRTTRGGKYMHGKRKHKKQKLSNTPTSQKNAITPTGEQRSNHSRNHIAEEEEYGHGIESHIDAASPAVTKQKYNRISHRIQSTEPPMPSPPPPSYSPPPPPPPQSPPPPPPSQFIAGDGNGIETRNSLHDIQNHTSHRRRPSTNIETLVHASEVINVPSLPPRRGTSRPRMKPLDSSIVLGNKAWNAITKTSPKETITTPRGYGKDSKRNGKTARARLERKLRQKKHR